jgi:carbamoyl-phosphate synthase large subunit
MPRRDDLQRILILGSGPIVIGQAAEFDYSGVQACKVLKDEGYEVVLVNSNPATIMTDPEFADATYVEPLLPGPVAQVIEKERPDALLPTLGGQTALNLARSLHEDGTLERYGVELIGANYDAIGRAEDRDLFRQTMEAAGLRMPRSAIAHSVEEALAALDEVGLPAIIRPAFTLGGRGGGIARTEDELREIVARGVDASPIGQVLLDQSVLGQFAQVPRAVGGGLPERRPQVRCGHRPLQSEALQDVEPQRVGQGPQCLGSPPPVLVWPVERHLSIRS